MSDCDPKPDNQTITITIPGGTLRLLDHWAAEIRADVPAKVAFTREELVCEILVDAVKGWEDLFGAHARSFVHMHFRQKRQRQRPRACRRTRARRGAKALRIAIERLLQSRW